MENEQQIAEAAQAVQDALQRLADASDMHLQHALGFGTLVAYKIYHPKSCPEHEAKRLAPANPEDMGAPKAEVPDAFKRLFEDEGK